MSKGSDSEQVFVDCGTVDRLKPFTCARLALCIARAMRSFPVPDSPRIKTVELDGATFDDQPFLDALHSFRYADDLFVYSAHPRYGITNDGKEFVAIEEASSG